ncbi:MAG: hypothetical protein AAF333_01755 [Planctomycetota bacterium]
MRTAPASMLIAAALTAAVPAAGQDKPWTPPSYDRTYRSTWHDGNAEMASYKLTYPRYGELRTGTAVAITVTEPFDPTARVKADSVRDDTYGVIKLNLVEDFQTGLYDYNLMTSVFVATEPANGLPAGSPTKVSFSSQEWCGHVYQQALFSQAKRGTPGVRQTLHSYFEGEADQNNQMDHPVGGIAEDALILWARGLAGPRLEPGESIEVPVYRSMAVQRHRHVPAKWETATLSRKASDEPLGEFTVDTFTADVAGRKYAFYIDNSENGDRKLIKLTRNDGYQLEFVAAERLPYWRLNGNADEKELKKMGLRRRGDGTM